MCRRLGRLLILNGHLLDQHRERELIMADIPTTEQIRTGYAYRPNGECAMHMSATMAREFDRWLADHDQQFLLSFGYDEHHTIDELYAYRMAYNAVLFNEWAITGRYPVMKSLKHSDGEECFGGGWFIVVAELPAGQISNHYEIDHWPLFQIPEVERPPTFDGHTSLQAHDRLIALAKEVDHG